MDQPLELEGNKIDSLLTEMTNIVRKLRRRNTGLSSADSAMMQGGATKAVSQAEISRLGTK